MLSIMREKCLNYKGSGSTLTTSTSPNEDTEEAIHTNMKKMERNTFTLCTRDGSGGPTVLAMVLSHTSSTSRFFIQEEFI